MKQLFLLIIPVLLLSSCAQNFIYEKDISLPEKVWTYENKLAFDFEVEDTESLYNLYLDIDHSVDFGSQNMYVKFYTQFPSKKVLTDVVSLELAGKGGIWFGNCGSEMCNLRIPIQSSVFFEQTGIYTVTVEQFTRKDNLPGIAEIGFRIENTGKKKS